MPSSFSEKLQDLMQRILVVDPAKRYTVADIRAHPWYNIVPPCEKIGTLIGKMEISIDEGIIQKVCNEYSVDPDQLRLELKKNKFNSSTTIYYMILKRAERSQKYKEKLKLDVSRLKSNKEPTQQQPVAEEKPAVPT